MPLWRHVASALEVLREFRQAMRASARWSPSLYGDDMSDVPSTSETAIDVHARARHQPGVLLSLVRVVALAAGVSIVIWGAHLLGATDQPSFAAFAVLTIGLICAVTFATLIGVDWQRGSQTLQAELRSPDCFVMPVFTTPHLRLEITQVMRALDQPFVHVAPNRVATVPADERRLEFAMGMGLSPRFAIPREAVSRIEAGTTKYSRRSVPSVDVVVSAAEGELRLSFLPIPPRLSWRGTERLPVIEAYVAELRRTMGSGDAT